MTQSGIYTITNLIDGKIYVGYAFSFSRRKRSHFSNLKLQKHPNNYLQNAYNLYGEKNFKFEILEECDPEFLCSQEHYWCNLLNVHNKKYGYNIAPTHPHKKCILSQETKDKISKANKGRSNIKNKGLLRTKEIKLKISEGWTKEKRQQQSLRLKNRRADPNSSINSKETQEKILKHIRKAVLQFDKNNNFIKEFNSIVEAERSIGIPGTQITAVCKGRHKTTGGFIWKYKNN